jgi:hypothetical protein
LIRSNANSKSFDVTSRFSGGAHLTPDFSVNVHVRPSPEVSHFDATSGTMASPGTPAMCL